MSLVGKKNYISKFLEDIMSNNVKKFKKPIGEDSI